MSIVIRNMCKKTTNDDIREETEKYGEVFDVHMPLDYYSAPTPPPFHPSTKALYTPFRPRRPPAHPPWAIAAYARRTFYNAAKTPRGFCFVEFGDEKAAEECINKLNGKQLDGWELKVERSKQKRKTPDEM